MIKRVVMWFVLVPFGIFLAVFAMANRHIVQIGLDPLSAENPFMGPVELPLFVVIYVTLLLGVLLGGIGSWLGQGKHRKAERQLRRDLTKVQKEAVPKTQQPANEDPLALLEDERS